MEINGHKTEYLVLENKTTAFDALSSTHEVEYKKYSIGVFILSIDGISQNSTHSWLYLINGSPPSVSADNYQLSSGDHLSFLFLSNEESMKYFE